MTRESLSMECLSVFLHKGGARGLELAYGKSRA